MTSRSTVSGPLVAAGTATAAAVGAVLGPVLLTDGFPLPARLFYGGLGGLVTGALIGAVASLLGCAAAAVVRQGGRGLPLQRGAFTLVGTVATLALSEWALPPLANGPRLLVLAGLAVVTVTAGTALSRRLPVAPGARG